MRVFDLLGNCALIENNLNDVCLKIDLSNKPEGIYFIEVESDDTKFVSKAVVQKRHILRDRSDLDR